MSNSRNTLHLECDLCIDEVGVKTTCLNSTLYPFIDNQVLFLLLLAVSVTLRPIVPIDDYVGENKIGKKRLLIRFYDQLTSSIDTL